MHCAKFQVILVYVANIQHNECYCMNYKSICCNYSINQNKFRKFHALIEILHTWLCDSIGKAREWQACGGTYSCYLWSAGTCSYGHYDA